MRRVLFAKQWNRTICSFGMIFSASKLKVFEVRTELFCYVYLCGRNGAAEGIIDGKN
jgi:hypothetical protein